jgi:hypothetical protein
LSVANGETFTAHIAPEQVHVFARDTGQRLE